MSQKNGSEQALRKLTIWGFWLGIMLFLSPFLLQGYGAFRQWQFHRKWVEATAKARVSAPVHILKLPAKKRAAVHSAPTPPPDDYSMVRLLIPVINVDAIVVHGVTQADLAEGPGFYPGSAMPGQPGNCSIAAHRNMAGDWFDHLNRLKTGDRVYLETPTRKYIYRVVGQEIVAPEDTQVLDSHDGRKELTLITCTHPATHRIIVHSVFDSVKPYA